MRFVLKKDDDKGGKVDIHCHYCPQFGGAVPNKLLTVNYSIYRVQTMFFKGLTISRKSTQMAVMMEAYKLSCVGESKLRSWN